MHDGTDDLAQSDTINAHHHWWHQALPGLLRQVRSPCYDTTLPLMTADRSCRLGSGWFRRSLEAEFSECPSLLPEP